MLRVKADSLDIATVILGSISTLQDVFPSLFGALSLTVDSDSRATKVLTEQGFYVRASFEH